MRATQELKELAARIADLPDQELLKRIASGAFAESAHRLALAEAQGRGLDLIPVAPEESEPETVGEAWQVVRRFASGTEAQIVARRLEVEDIPAHVATGGVLLTDSATSDPGAGAARLSVPASMVPRAQALLRELEAGDLALEGESESPATYTDLSDRRLFAFTGDPYYVEADRRLRTGAQLAGFNFVAAILGTTWCVHRKCYAYGAAVLALDAIAIGLGSGTAIPWATSLLLLVARAGMGVAANPLYLRRVNGRIAALAATHADEVRLEGALKAAGGTNLPAVIVLIIAAGVLPALLRG